jgi:hypothetical protein
MGYVDVQTQFTVRPQLPSEPKSSNSSVFQRHHERCAAQEEVYSWPSLRQHYLPRSNVREMVTECMVTRK